MSKKIIFSTALILVSLSLSILGQTQDAARDEDLDRRITKREYTDISDKHRWEIKAEYPELLLSGGKPANAFNQLAKSMAMKHVADFKESMAEYTDEDRKYLPKDANYDLQIVYNIEFLNEELISVNFGRSEYTGGAHPNHWSFVLNYDLKNSRVIKLEELFKANSGFLKVISESSIEQISDKQGEYADKDWITRGAGENLKNFESWNVTEKGLKFTFDPYQVGPYVAGDFETIVPYEKFARETRSEKFYPVSLASYIDGNPPNWCRNGHFPQYDVDFKLAKIKGTRGKSKLRAYFYKDGNSCPDGVNCREKKYVIPGDEVIVARNYGEFSCVWYQPRKGSETVGWIKTSDLLRNESSVKPGPIDWKGNWVFGESSIKIAQTKILGNFQITGNAFWKGLGDNVHIGELNFVGTADKNKLNAGTGDDKYDCRVKIKRLGKYLIVTDNKNCGGLNVTFDGVYKRK